jgi:hypothetical protein
MVAYEKAKVIPFRSSGYDVPNRFPILAFRHDEQALPSAFKRPEFTQPPFFLGIVKKTPSPLAGEGWGWG